MDYDLRRIRKDTDPDDDNAERVRLLECALELKADRMVSGDSVLLEPDSYMGIPILTPRELLEEVGEVPEE
jgi:predicted nucleic acid-binding protein